MSHSPNVSEAALNSLLDHAVAQDRALKKVADRSWYALEILTEADRIFSIYGYPPAPNDELRPLLEMIRHFRLTAPEAPTDGVCGEAPPSVGPNVDIAFTENIRGAVEDLRGDE